jgi:signal transduction histidine kinase
MLKDVLPQLELNMKEVSESIGKSEIIEKHKRLRIIDGEKHFENITIYPLMIDEVNGAVIRVDDVTKLALMETMVIQSEKMLSVGGLAAGMAHEINNPLAGITQTANVIARRLWNSTNIPANRNVAEELGLDLGLMRTFMEKREIPKMLDSMLDAVKRVSEIVRDMLSFARKSENVKSAVNLSELIDKTLELASTDYNLKKQYDFKNIDIVRNYSDQIPLIPCDVGKLQQVFLNLFRNGAEALSEAGIMNPQFTIRLSMEKSKERICIEIEDNGPGINAEEKKRIFEPFFTTKAPGVGTGLGLSVSYFIITENHNGEMHVESELDRGTKFVIRLPLKS